MSLIPATDMYICSVEVEEESDRKEMTEFYIYV